MSILTEAAVEFARQHIQNYYDSDFFPKAFEYDAIWHSWPEVKKFLVGTNVSKFRVKHPLIMAAKKPSGSYRIVHQLEPIDTIIYTALAYTVSSSVEGARACKEVACSYRIAAENGGFFERSSSFKFFADRVEKLVSRYDYILVTDITDFYNQIYLHRLNNALERANPRQKIIADDIETFVTSLNDKASQGIPVGPAASIIMSEAVLIDIDEFISNQGVEHTRYVDDIRIFSESKEELEKVLEVLTLYLHKIHRLTLSSDKTVLQTTKEYTESVLHSQYEMEKVEIFEDLKNINPYDDGFDDDDTNNDSQEKKVEDYLNDIVEQIFKRDYLDLGLARALIRKAKRTKTENIADTIFAHFDFFSPVINDVILYFKALSDGRWEDIHQDKFFKLCDSPVIQQDLVRFWLEWYFASNKFFMSQPKIKKFLMQSSFVENKALAAITSGNVSWVRDNKSDVFSVGERGKRAILHSTKILPKDEKIHWLKNIEKNTPEELDKWLIKWLLDQA